MGPVTRPTSPTQPGRFSSIVIDTNVWLDYYLGFREGNRDACELLTVANRAGVNLLCAVTTTKDLFYLIAADFKRDWRRRHDGQLDENGIATARETAWACLKHLECVATAVGCDQSDIWLARAQRVLHDNFEDNLVIAAAQRAHADCLVTNDQELLRRSPVAALSCRDAIAYLRATTDGAR